MANAAQSRATGPLFFLKTGCPKRIFSCLRQPGNRVISSTVIIQLQLSIAQNQVGFGTRYDIRDVYGTFNECDIGTSTKLMFFKIVRVCFSIPRQKHVSTQVLQAFIEFLVTPFHDGKRIVRTVLLKKYDMFVTGNSKTS